MIVKSLQKVVNCSFEAEEEGEVSPGEGTLYQVSGTVGNPT